MKRGFLIIAFLLSLTSFIYVSAQQLIFKTYTVQDGLVANPVRRVFQDSNGFIWFMTWEGLSKYDGQRFTNFSTANGLSFNLVNDLYESKDRKLYVAENNGAIDIIQHDAVIKRSAGNTTINRFLTLPSGKVIACSDSHGLFEMVGHKLIKPGQTAPDVDYGDLALWNDSLLIGGMVSELRVLNLNYDRLARINTASLNNQGVLIQCVFIDSKNNCWVGTNAGLKRVVAPIPGNKSGYTLIPGFPGNELLTKTFVNGISEDPSGNILISSHDGLIILKPDGPMQLYTEKDGLPSNLVYCAFRDREDNIWIGTHLGVAKLVTKNRFRVFTMRQGLFSNAITDLVSLGKDQVLIVNQGVQLINLRESRITGISTEKEPKYTGFIKNSKDLILFSNNAPFTGQINSQNNTIRNSSSRPMYDGLRDSIGHIFVAAYFGINVLMGSADHAIREFPFRTNNLLLDRNGYLWAGTWQDGLYRLHFTFTGDSYDCSIMNMSHLIQGKEVRSLFEDRDGNIWVGTRYNGVVRLSPEKNNKFNTFNWTRSTGLMADWIKSIAQDEKGNIWLGTQLGIDKLVRLDTGYRVFNFSRMNNFYSDINAILPRDNNLILFGTGSGLVSITDEHLEDLSSAPVYLTSVLLGAGKEKIQWHEQDQKASLHYRQNQASFEFASPAFINEKQVLYSYRLQGSEDTNWSVPANTNSISYASLQAGHYRFEVKALGWDGEFGEVSAFNFIINPPFWKTWWFISIIIGLIAAGIYGIYRYRINQLIKMQRVRNRIATDLHDEIGSSLTNISLLSELTNNNIEQPGQARTFIHRISEEVNSSSQALDDIVWSINPGNDSLEQIVARMRRYAAEIFDAANITYSLDMEEQFATRKLSMDQRRDVFLIFKEAVNNIYKHARAKYVDMKLGVRNNELYFTIKDDGTGFDTNAVNGRNGIRNMKLRIAKWKGRVDIKSDPGSGTHASFYLPLAKASLK